MLLGAAADLLRAGDVRSLTFPYLTSPALAEVRALLPGGLAGVPAVAADPDAVLRLPGAGFDDYLAAFRSGRRRAIRRELAAFERAGYRIEIGGLHGQAAALAPLLAAVQGRHGASDSVQRMRRYLVAQERAFGDQATVFRCLRGDRLAGFSLFYEHGDALWGRVAGLDYAQAERDAAVYFNVACYAPIHHAYRRGLRRVHWGPGSYDAKVFRGADLAERWSVTLLSSAVGPRAERTAHSAR
jgi:predicted N-acyltransferase